MWLTMVVVLCVVGIFRWGNSEGHVGRRQYVHMFQVWQESQGREKVNYSAYIVNYSLGEYIRITMSVHEHPAFNKLRMNYIYWQHLSHLNTVFAHLKVSCTICILIWCSVPPVLTSLISKQHSLFVGPVLRSYQRLSASTQCATHLTC